MHSRYKYLRSIPVLLFLAAVLPSCKKFLAENPESFVSTSNYYQTKSDAISAVNAIYGYLNSTETGNTAGVYHSTFWVIQGLASDEMLNKQTGSPYFDQLSNFTYNPQNSALDETWTMHYKAILLANIAIGRIPAINMDTVLKSRLVNEAKFLRGLLYFDLVRMFGDVPLLTNEVEPLYPPRDSTSKVYAQVISDLTDAQALPASYSGADQGRATSGAARSILAKVYLTTKNYRMVSEKCLEVINSNQYQLWPDFKQVFEISSLNGQETIFSVEFGDAGGAISFWEVGQFNVRLLPPALSAEGVQNAQGWQVPTHDLYNDFDPNDRRTSVTFVTQVYNPDGTVTQISPYIRKYWDSLAEPAGNGSNNAYPVIRYADVLLMFAEASNELGDMGDAYTYLNMVRKRARFNGATYLNILPDYSNLTQDQFRTAVLKERRMEFVAEGERWFDLARTGTLQTLVPIAKPGVTPQAKNYLFPIPQTERDLDANLTQNINY